MQKTLRADFLSMIEYQKMRMIMAFSKSEKSSDSKSEERYHDIAHANLLLLLCRRKGSQNNVVLLHMGDGNHKLF